MKSIEEQNRCAIPDKLTTFKRPSPEMSDFYFLNVNDKQREKWRTGDDFKQLSTGILMRDVFNFLVNNNFELTPTEFKTMFERDLPNFLNGKIHHIASALGDDLDDYERVDFYTWLAEGSEYKREGSVSLEDQKELGFGQGTPLKWHVDMWTLYRNIEIWELSVSRRFSDYKVCPYGAPYARIAYLLAILQVAAVDTNASTLMCAQSDRILSQMEKNELKEARAVVLHRLQSQTFVTYSVALDDKYGTKSPVYGESRVRPRPVQPESLEDPGEAAQKRRRTEILEERDEAHKRLAMLEEMCAEQRQKAYKLDMECLELGYGRVRTHEY